MARKLHLGFQFNRPLSKCLNNQINSPQFTGQLLNGDKKAHLTAADEDSASQMFHLISIAFGVALVSAEVRMQSSV